MERVPGPLRRPDYQHLSNLLLRLTRQINHRLGDCIRQPQLERIQQVSKYVEIIDELFRALRCLVALYSTDQDRNRIQIDRHNLVVEEINKSLTFCAEFLEVIQRENGN